MTTRLRKLLENASIPILAVLLGLLVSSMFVVVAKMIQSKPTSNSFAKVSARKAAKPLATSSYFGQPMKMEAVRQFSPQPTAKTVTP